MQDEMTLLHASDEPSEIAEESGCYLGLTRSSDKWSIRLRRARKEELKDLPPRPEQVFYVPLAEKKAEAAEAYPE